MACQYLTDYNQTRNDESGPRSWGLDRARYMIKRSQYNEFLEIIEDGNATLERLLNANIDPAVESNRRIRSGGRFLTIARNISRNVYIALSSSISCNCSVSHGVNLELLHPPSRPSPRDDDDLIASKMLFRLSLAYDPDLRDVKDTTWLWDEVELRVRRIEPQHPPGNMVAIPKASGKPRKTVQFSMKTATDAGRQSPQLSTTLLPAEMASLTVQTSLGILNKTEQAPELSDLCQTIQRCQHQKDVQCYGYVSSPSAAEYHKFGVYPVRTEQDYSNWSTISLKNVLDNKASVPLLRFRDKQKLAAIIASNVLQHPGSSWLPDMVTSDDILFINRQGKELYEQAFVAKRLPETEAVEPPCNPMNSTDCIQNRMLFGLGIVLLEIALGRTLDSLRGPSEQSLRRSSRNLLQDYKIAEEHLDMVKRSGGEDYGRAVQRCIRCEFLSRNHSLDDDEFRQEVYGTVVAPLEENVRAIQAGSKRFY